MAPDSRPPLTTQRPPLATRLRRSFDSKRSKTEVTSPTSYNGYAVQDPDALQAAVDQAINSEAFQNAISANIARILKPSIKSALDTIQPVVEAVYSHDVLLRKTNKSVEDVLDRMDTISEETEDGRALTPRQRSGSAGSFYDVEFKALMEKSNKRTIVTLAELSNAIQSNTSKLSGLEAQLGETRGSFEYLKDYLESHLDQVQADMGKMVDTMEAERKTRAVQGDSDGNSLLLAHTTKLDTISTDLAGLKAISETSAKLEAISAEINALRASTDAGNSANHQGFTELDAKIVDVNTIVQAHEGSLHDIYQQDNTSSIMAAIQKSHDYHISHTSALEEMKERSLAQSHDFHNSHASHASVLEEIKQRSLSPAADSDTPQAVTLLQELKSHLGSLKENIEYGLTSSNVNLTGLGSKIESVVATVESQKAADSSTEILAALQKSNDFHALHSASLDGIKSRAIDTAPANDQSNLAALETHIGSIIATLESHTTSLDEIRSSKSASPNDSFEVGISNISTALEKNTKTLGQIKDDISAEILTALHGIGQTQAGHTTTLAEIRESDVSDEILTALHTSNDAHSAHQSALEKLQVAVQASNDSHEKHGISLGEIKSKSLEPTSVNEASEPIDLNVKLNKIESALDEHNTTLAIIKEATISSLDSHSAHILSLKEIQDSTAAFKDLHASHATHLSEIKDASLRTKELQDAHAATLADLIIATGTSNDAHRSHTEALSGLEAVLKDTKSGVDSHSVLVKDLHSETKDSHSSLATTISALAIGGAIGGGAGVLVSQNEDDNDSSKELLQEVQAVKDIVEKSLISAEKTKETITSIAAQIDINHTTITTSITTLSDELKAEVDASSTEIVDSVSKLGAEIDNANGTVRTVEEKLQVLAAGVHFSEKGLGQLKYHAPVVSVKEILAPDSPVEAAVAKNSFLPEPAPVDLEGSQEREIIAASEALPSPVIGSPVHTDVDTLEDPASKETEVPQSDAIIPAKEGEALHSAKIVQKTPDTEIGTTDEQDILATTPNPSANNDGIVESEPKVQNVEIAPVLDEAIIPTTALVAKNDESISSREIGPETSESRPILNDDHRSLSELERSLDETPVPVDHDVKSLSELERALALNETSIPVTEAEQPSSGLTESTEDIKQDVSDLEPSAGLQEEGAALQVATAESISSPATAAEKPDLATKSTLVDENSPPAQPEVLEEKESIPEPSLAEEELTSTPPQNTAQLKDDEETAAIKTEESAPPGEPELSTQKAKPEDMQTLAAVEPGLPSKEAATEDENSPIAAIKPDLAEDEKAVHSLPILEPDLTSHKLKEISSTTETPDDAVAVKDVDPLIEEQSTKEDALAFAATDADEEVPTSEGDLAAQKIEDIVTSSEPVDDAIAVASPLDQVKEDTPSTLEPEVENEDLPKAEPVLKSPALPEPTDDESEPVTPATPSFPVAAEADAEPVESPSGKGKKGKKGKKEKGGGKKGKKEKVPFVMDGDDA